MCFTPEHKRSCGPDEGAPVKKSAHLVIGGIKSRLWLFQNRNKGYRKHAASCIVPKIGKPFAPARLCG
jgi:hypothetical protein